MIHSFPNTLKIDGFGSAELIRVDKLSAIYHISLYDLATSSRQTHKVLVRLIDEDLPPSDRVVGVSWLTPVHFTEKQQKTLHGRFERNNPGCPSPGMLQWIDKAESWVSFHQTV